MMGAGLRPSGKPLDWPPYPKMQSAPHFYPDRIGPEPCAGVREGVGEASAGECIGQPMSRERVESREPTPSAVWKATRMGAIARVPICPGVVGEPGMCRRSLSLGTGELAFDRSV
jgi:hypothetical protein